MKLGMVGALLDVDESKAFARAARLGLEGVEIPLATADVNAVDGWVARVRSLMSRHGLAAPSLMLGEHNGGSLASTDPARVKRCEADVRAAIRMAAAVGAETILVPFFFAGQVRTEAAFAQVVSKFRELSPIAAAQGIALTYEGDLPATQIVRMCEAVGAQNFGCYFDLGNVVWLGLDTATEIRRLGKWVKAVHMKESRVGPGDARPGLGRVNYAEAAVALGEIGYDGWLVMETPGGPDELIARDMSYCRRVFPRIKPAKPWPRLGGFSHATTIDELPAMIADFRGWGLTCVQLAPDLIAVCLGNEEAAKEVAGQLRDGGLEVAGLGAYRPFAGRDALARRDGIEYLQRCLRLAPMLGTSVVATETGSMHADDVWKGHPENFDAGAWKQVTDGLAELLPVAREHGAILALEAYVNNVLQNVNQVQDLFDRFPSPHLGLVLDPFNYLSSHLLPAQGRIVQGLLDAFESRFVLAHLKDVAVDGAEVDTPEFGAGVFEYGRYFDFLRKRRPDLPIVLEHLPREHVPAAVSRFRKMAGV